MLPQYKCPCCEWTGKWSATVAHVGTCCPGETCCLIKEGGSSTPKQYAPPPPKPNQYAPTKWTLQARIVQIVRGQNGSVVMSGLPILYEAQFGTKLDVKAVGVTKLKSLLEDIPALGMRNKPPKNELWVYMKGSGAEAARPAKRHSEEAARPAAARPAAAPSAKKTGGLPGERKASVKLAVEDTTADIVTFDQAVSGIGSRLSTVSLDDGEADGSTDKETKESNAPPYTAADEAVRSYFAPRTVDEGGSGSGGPFFDAGLALSDRRNASRWEEGALLGHLTVPSGGDDGTDDENDDGAVYMNTHEPFCFAAVGVQGAGKSHTLSCVLESCLVPFEVGGKNGGDVVVKLKKPMTALVLHYDQNTTSLCESAGLLVANPDLDRLLGKLGRQGTTAAPCVPRSKAVVMVSPTYFRQRKAFYGDYCLVKPLLFRWKSLTADHIKRIMRIQEGDNQLYVASFMALLRSYQRQAVVPDFADFMEQVRSVCNIKGQQGPLDQRIALLESMVAESEMNQDLREESLDLSACVTNAYSLIITDLTDPLLSKEEANCLFQVLTEQFRSLPVSGGKLLCLDEAHKFMDGIKQDGLSEAIVDVARLMRHDGVRLAVSTQSPHALAPELLELVSVAVLHHFHSLDWWTYMQKKLSLRDAAWGHILALKPGNALAFATRHNLTTENVEGSHILPIHVRPRITADLGSSRRNV